MTATSAASSDCLTGWSGLNLQYLIGKVDWLTGHTEEDKMRNMQTWDQAPGSETAFLGPHFWDKKLSMKMFNYDMGCTDIHVGGGGYHNNHNNSKTFHTDSESPSPPHFQQHVRRYLSIVTLVCCDTVTGVLPPS